MTTLAQRFLHQDPDLPVETYPRPAPRDICLYIHTSSATSVSNLKCVPLSHGLILSGCQTQLAWLKKTRPHDTFDHLRVLGWSPFSHILSVSIDIGAHTFLTAGCYVFALTPSTYFVSDSRAESLDQGLDIATMLLRAMLKEKPTAFAGVPWVLEGLMKTWTTDLALRDDIGRALQLFKVFICGGAKTSDDLILWAKERQLALVLGLGMTEVGGMSSKSCRSIIEA